MELQYTAPAACLLECLPLGNGRLGAMCTGGIAAETIYLNEETLYDGPPDNTYNPDMLAMRPKVRALLQQGKTAEAEALALMALTSPNKYPHPYVPLGQLLFTYQHGTAGASNGLNGNTYARVLDISTGVETVAYTCDNANFTRTRFASFARPVLVFHLAATSGQALSFRVTFSRRPYDGTLTAENNTLHMVGTVGQGGVSYSARTAVQTDGQCSTIGGFINVQNASYATVVVAAASSYNHTNETAATQGAVTKALGLSFAALLAEHTAVFTPLYSTASFTLTLQGTDPNTEVPAPLAMAEKLYAYSRYLLLSASYNCALPANLQGIWNASFTPPWESGYTININLEMNYWAAHIAGLSACTAPLHTFISNLCESGKTAAAKLYGARGSVAHHVSDSWHRAQPSGIFPTSPFWNMGLAWLALHLWQHFQFTEDEVFLQQQALPVMLEAARFFIDVLWEDESGLLLNGPSLSPENSYYDANGTKAAICLAPMMDSEIVTELFNAIVACEEWIENKSLLAEIKQALPKLPQPRINKKGRLQEWLQDYTEALPGHRHISHLFALYPGSTITASTPAFFAAAEKSLDARIAAEGDLCGWSRMWMACCYARLGCGDKAWQLMQAFAQQDISPNLLCQNPTNQMDANFGYAAAVCELLVQCTAEGVLLLPALPTAWQNGQYHGYLAVGGHGIALTWRNGRLTQAIITPAKAQAIQLLYQGLGTPAKLIAGQPFIYRPE